MKVRAISQGFHGGRRRREGEIFDVPEGAKSKWFVPVESATIAKPESAKGKASKKEPDTFSALAKSDAATVAPEGGGGDLV